MTVCDSVPPPRGFYEDCSFTGELDWPLVAAIKTSTVPATLSIDSIGEDVKRLQRVLARQLFWNPFGPITGVFDASLETCAKLVQQNNGLVVDGIVGPATWTVFPSYREASPELREGSKGPAVAWLHKALAGNVVTVEFTPYSGAIDGIFGPKTDEAVRAFQSWGGQPPNGVLGDDTWFIWMTPGSAQQLTLEAASNLTTGLL
jgi:peptidoglycan hydrolase-like protein with peptidoglycan-binding domain